MRLTTAILILTIMQVSASVSAQRITLSQQEISLEQIFKVISRQTGYDVVVSSEQLKSAKKISVNFKNATIEEVLSKSMENQDLSWTIQQKTIVISQKEQSVLDKLKNYFKAIDIRGRVLDEKGNPLVGAIIRVKGDRISISTDQDGNFTIRNVDQNAILQVSYLGYRVREFKASEMTGFFSVNMELSDNKLNEVEIVSTGYQTLSKERATGSFDLVNNKLFNRRTGTDVFSRLDGIISSFIQFKSSPLTPLTGPLFRMSIRGTNSLSLATPLLVVDDFPYDGDSRNINPNDVESVTVLKDAAAASIWGSRAANGVIVITTKKGSFDRPLKISLNSNFTISNRPDLYYINTMSSSDFIDVEEFLFNKGYYDLQGYFDPSSESYFPKTPILEILNQQRSNTITSDEAKTKIDFLRNVDSRRDFLKYLYRPATYQQYAIDFSGGGKQMNYRIAAGFDKNLNNLVTSSYERLNLKASTTLQVVRNLDVQTDIAYTKRKYKDISRQHTIAYGTTFALAGTPSPPYLRLADEQGDPLPVEGMYPSKTYRETAGNGLLFDWLYRPLAELDASSDINSSDELLLNVGTAYKISPVFKATIKYQYQKTNGNLFNYNSVDSYYTRDYINKFTEYNDTHITASPVPIGDIFRSTTSTINSQSLRGQLDASKEWNDVHELNAIAGTELREVGTYNFDPSTLYGYSKETLTYTPVDFFTRFTSFNGLEGPSQIFDGAGYFNTRIDRYVSIFANAAYTYKQRYTLSTSFRTDGSNLFGVRQNNKLQPLWSLGTSWNISSEHFYKNDFLPFLKLRLTYGYLGNASNGTSAYPSISYVTSVNNVNGQIYATGNTPPNDNLRWEKTGQLNLGIDFGIKNNRLSGYIEYYDKHSSNLIAQTVADPTSGFSSYNLNSAHLHGYGLDVALNSINLKGGKWSWSSNFLLSYNRSIVTKYLAPATSILRNLDYTAYGLTIRPVVGNDLYGLYTLKFAGLDPFTGDPLGYLNGLPSKAYSAITAPTTINDLEFHGSTRPLYFGAIRNTFTLRALSLSVNLQYKLDYKFQHQVTNYDAFFQGNVSIYRFNNRWTKPGDESHTNIPSMYYPQNFARERFYSLSSASVEKGDHIRLQDITLDYTFNKINTSIKNLKLYANASNLGVIWRANKLGIDPDYGDMIPAPLTFSFGLSANF